MFSITVHTCYPLCLGVVGGKGGVKDIMERMEIFDDLAYVRVIV